MVLLTMRHPVKLHLNLPIEVIYFTIASTIENILSALRFLKFNVLRKRKAIG